jgi:zinc protease
MKQALLLGLLLWVAIPSVWAAEPKIIFEEDPTLLVSNLQVVVLSGAAQDPSSKSGLSNLLGELMLRGTKKRSRTKFQSEVERLGAQVGVQASHDNIIFIGRVIKENTPQFLKLIEDFLLNPAFNKKEFESLKTELIAEIVNKKNQNSRLPGMALRREVFAGSVLEHPLDGGLSTIKAITLEDVQRSYNNAVHRGNVLFAVSSAIKETEFKKALTEMWQKLPDGLHDAYKSVPLQTPSKPRVIVVDKSHTSTGSMLFGQLGITAQDPLRYRLILGNQVFGAEPLVSRLFRVVRGENGWTYSVGTTYTAMGNLTYQQGLYAISATPAVEFTAKMLLKVLEMWKDYRNHSVKPEELKLVQESAINSYPFEFDSAEARLNKKLRSYLYDIPILSPEQYAKTITEIDAKKIKEAVQQKQSADGWLIAMVADPKVVEKQLEEEQKKIPEADRIKISKVLTPDQVIE